MMGTIGQLQDPEGELGVLGEYPDYRQGSSQGSLSHPVPHRTIMGSAVKAPIMGYS